MTAIGSGHRQETRLTPNPARPCPCSACRRVEEKQRLTPNPARPCPCSACRRVEEKQRLTLRASHSRLPARERTAWRAAVPASAVAVANLLVAGGVTGAVRAPFLLPILLLLPGWLTLRACRWDRPPGWDRLLYSLALSLLWLLAISFLLAVLPIGGGLSTRRCLIGFDLVAVGLLVAGNRDVPSAADGPPPVASSARVLPRRMVAALGCGSAAVCLAVAGAWRLNTGGGPGVAAIALAAGAAALLFGVSGAAARDKRGKTVVERPGAGRSNSGEEVTCRQEQGGGIEHAVATTVYLVGLAVLLATSLRGTGATGHDIKIEFAVFEDTLSRGSWRPGGQYVSYNSCLSITVLPTFLCRMLEIPPLEVYRVCYQIIFAAVPVGVFLIARRFLPPSGALLSSALFIAFPTFINDMPMLNRQEIALVFFVVGVLTLVDTRGSARRRTTLFIVLAVGLTVSHYSTTYVAAAILLIGRALLAGRSVARRLRARSAGGASPGALALPAVIALIAFATGWGTFTGNSESLVTTGRTTVATIGLQIGANSDSVNYSFVERAPPLTDQQALDAYLADIRKHREPSAASAPGCQPQVLPPDSLALTRAGYAMSSLGVPAGKVNIWARRAAVVVFEAGALAGVGLLWWRSRRSTSVDAVLAVLGVACLGILGTTVALPQLSASYGLLRLYQQALIVLAPAAVGFLAAAAHLVGRMAGGRSAQCAKLLPPAVVVGCLLTTSGLLPQLTGGYSPQLNLNNAGAYYRAYYVSAADLAVSRWADQHIPDTAAVAADTADTATLRSATRLYVMEGVGPGIVPPYAYLQVRMRNTAQVHAVATFRERILTYTLPLSCVTRDRRLLYADDHHRVYGPAA